MRSLVFSVRLELFQTLLPNLAISLAFAILVLNSALSESEFETVEPRYVKLPDCVHH